MSLPRGYRYAGEHPSFSLVIPTHEGSVDWLEACLKSVLDQESSTPVELLIVFDGPAPQATALARRVTPAARQIHLKRQRGFAGAADEGLRAARADLVGVLNDDTRLEAGWVEAMLSAAERHPNAGSFASRIVREDAPETIDSAGHGLTRWGEAFAIGGGLPDGPNFDEEQEVFGAPATAAVLRRELLIDTRGLDRSMEAYLEDVDLSLRAQVLGFPCLYVPDARVSHRGSSSYGWGPSGSGRAEWLLARNRIHMLCKSMPREALLSAAPATLVSVLADLTHRTLTGRHPIASLRGTIEGIRSVRTSLSGRAATLGGQRVDREWLRRVLRTSELQLVDLSGTENARWRSSRATLSRLLTAWVDARERNTGKRSSY